MGVAGSAWGLSVLKASRIRIQERILDLDAWYDLASIPSAFPWRAGSHCSDILGFDRGTHMEAAVQVYKGSADKREDAFKKSVEAHKSHQDVLSKKFDEMLRLAKESPDEPPPKRDIDFD